MGASYTADLSGSACGWTSVLEADEARFIAGDPSSVTDEVDVVLSMREPKVCMTARPPIPRGARAVDVGAAALLGLSVGPDGRLRGSDVAICGSSLNNYVRGGTLKLLVLGATGA